MNDRDLEGTEGIPLDLGLVFRLAGKHLWLLTVAAVLGAGIAVAVLHFGSPIQYQSSVLFYVNNGSESREITSSISSGDLSTSRNLVDSYIVILKTREALLDVLCQAGLDIPYLELVDMISASAVNKTEFFRVTVTGPDPYQAEKIANAIGEVLPARIAAIIEGTTARVVEPAVAAWNPISPGYGRCALVGFLVGVLLSLSGLLLRELFEGPVWNEEDIRRACVYPVLAWMPKRRTGWWRKADAPTAMPPGETEAYNRICAKLRLAFARECPCRILGISSALEGEGKSGIAENLALTLSRQGKTVLLIDGNLARPAWEKRENQNGTGGLSEFLAGQMDSGELFRRREALTVIPAGEIPPDPEELLGSGKMQAFLAEQRKNYDYILLDLGTVSEGLAVARGVDGVMLVVRRKRCTRRALKNAAQTLEAEKIRVLGLVGNGGKEGSV